MLAICELLVAAGVVKEIVLTRLPVGHTHEDIDSKFGKIWTALRSKNILTPQDYEAELRKVFESGSLKFDVKDVFLTPDYASWLEPHIDSKLSRWTKELFTQLQWSFTPTERSEHFPTGVKVMYVIHPMICVIHVGTDNRYRAYSSDVVIEILKSNPPHESSCSQALGLKASQVAVQWYPVNIDDR